MKVERRAETKLFEFSRLITPNQLYNEVIVTITFIIGMKDPKSFSGRPHPILDGDQSKMEAESFLEAAQKAWAEKYGGAGIEKETANFVKQSLENKWKELRGEELTSKKLEF